MSAALRAVCLRLFPIAIFVAPFTLWAQSMQIDRPVREGVAEMIGTIDTTVGEQISPHSGLSHRFFPENPKIRPYNYSNLPPSRIRPGGVMSEARSAVDALFPGISQDQWSPPDCTLAVGPNHVVSTVNMKIAFHDKNGNLQYLKWLGNQEAGGFMAGIGALNFTFDPKCLYDAATGRFFVVVPEKYNNPNRSWINIAVSDDSDPNGTWYFYRTDSIVVINGSQYWVDYPGFGIDQNGVYVTGNLFGFSSGFGGGWFRCFRKSNMISGAATTFVDFRDSGNASIQCSQATGNPQAAFFTSVSNTSTLAIHAVRDLMGSPTKVTTTVAVPAFSYPNSDAPQQGSTSTCDTLDGRIMNAWYRNGRLITSHAVRTAASGNRTVGRWYEFNMGNWPNSGGVTLVQAGNVDWGGLWALFPAVAFNDFNDMGMMVGGSSSAQFAAVYLTGRKLTDPAGAMGMPALAKAGTSAWTGGRWGDYFGIQVDPNDGLTFWGIGEYCEGGTWKTWITSWQVATYRNLTVQSSGDVAVNVPGVAIECTQDGRGNGNGPTPFVRTYYDGAGVTLTAPGIHVGNGRWAFVRWMVNGVSQPMGQRTINVTLTSATSAEAQYTLIALG